MTTSVLRDAMQLVINAGMDPTTMQWFDISNAAHTPPKQDWLMTYRPPFEKCIVCFRGPSPSHASYDMFLLVSGDDPHEGISLSLLKGPTGTKLRFLPAIGYRISDDQIDYWSIEENVELSADETRLTFKLVMLWYMQMAASCATYRPALQNTFTNKRKIAAGKLPTYDWTTVTIGPKTVRGEFKGGTHASPRQHERRGHLRTFKNGKSIWVKSHKVGSATNGAVFHDYVVQ